MSDLIDRTSLAEHKFPSNECNGFGMGNAYRQGWNDAIDAIIDNAPSAEPEIIRCKDCKHYVVHTSFVFSQGWCERLCDEFDKSLARGTEEDDFCSRAERRQDG